MGDKVAQHRERIDKKHRFPLRISETIHCEAEALAFKYNVSLNLLYVEAINYAMASDGFMQKLALTHQRDDRRGHFTYIVDENTKRKGRVL
jgi:hypothetical protein